MPFTSWIRGTFVATLALISATAFTGAPLTTVYADANSTSNSTSPAKSSAANSSSSASNSDTVQNFAPTASIQVSTDGPPDYAFQKLEQAHHAPLTSTTKWRGFCRQNGRSVVVDMTYDRPIQSISIEMEQNPYYGIYFPSHVDFDVNIGGQWYALGSAKSKVSTSATGYRTQTYEVNVPNVDAHLVRIRFPVGVWVMARNLKVMCDSFALPGSQTLPNLPKETATANQVMTTFDKRDQGIHNMALAYTGANGSNGVWKLGDFLPMVGYQLPDGSIGGRMFDTIDFTPYGSVPDTKAGWQTYLNALFAKQSGLAALDAATAQVDAAMKQFGGNPSQKEKVVITLPYPQYGDANWGSLNGSGLSFKQTGTTGTRVPDHVVSVAAPPVHLDVTGTGAAGAMGATGTTSTSAALPSIPVNTSANLPRLSALEWFIQSFMAQWNAADYPNLQLVGFAWGNESLPYGTPGETSLIQQVSDSVHQAGQSFLWIPYYGASGSSDWQYLGFDAAWLQPNYIEQGLTAEDSRIHDAETAASQDGMGLEVEALGQMLHDAQYRTLYLHSMQRLEDDKMAGNVSHAFYEGTKIMVTAAHASNPDNRALYDATYGFITHS